jgi:hypothetical protein
MHLQLSGAPVIPKLVIAVWAVINNPFALAESYTLMMHGIRPRIKLNLKRHVNPPIMMGCDNSDCAKSILVME